MRNAGTLSIHMRNETRFMLPATNQFNIPNEWQTALHRGPPWSCTKQKSPVTAWMTAGYKAGSIKLNFMLFLMKQLLCVATGRYSRKCFITESLHWSKPAQFYAIKPNDAKNKPITWHGWSCLTNLRRLQMPTWSKAALIFGCKLTLWPVLKCQMPNSVCLG